jgi:hypothetical protein
MAFFGRKMGYSETWHEALSNKKNENPTALLTMAVLAGKGGYFQKLAFGSETSDRTSVELGEMFEGDSADTCPGNFSPNAGRVDGLACGDPSSVFLFCIKIMYTNYL